MKKQTYEELKEKLEKLKRSIPYLEDKIKTKNEKEIENSIYYLVYILHKMDKEIGDKSTAESIQNLSRRLWWFKNQKEKERRKFTEVKDLYDFWAEGYDEEVNLAIFLEEKIIGKYIKEIKGKDILDFGCETGRYTIPLAKKGARVTGIDFSKKMLKIAEKKAKKEKLDIEFKHVDVLRYKPYRKFNLIISMLVLDHIQKLEEAIKVIDKASKIGTQVIISNIHPEVLKKTIDPLTGRPRGEILEGKSTDQFYHPLSEYINLFLDKGFILIKTDNLYFEPKYRKLKKFKKFLGMKDEPLGLIMKFEKIK